MKNVDCIQIDQEDIVKVRVLGSVKIEKLKRISNSRLKVIKIKQEVFNLRYNYSENGTFNDNVRLPIYEEMFLVCFFNGFRSFNSVNMKSVD